MANGCFVHIFQEEGPGRLHSLLRTSKPCARSPGAGLGREKGTPPKQGDKEKAFHRIGRTHQAAQGCCT